MDRGYTRQRFVSLVEAGTAERQISRLFALEIGPQPSKLRGGQAWAETIKGNYHSSVGPFSSCHSFYMHYGN